MTTWFTADTHFGHKNIIKFTNRPFSSVAEMDEALITNWNARVQPGDDVFHLGDFALNSVARCREIIKRLRGNIHLIRGNHEESADACADEFVWVKDYHELLMDDPEGYQGKQPVVLLHYAMRVWNASHYGSFHLYGHSHGTLPDNQNARSLDVGVDVHAFAPISYERVKSLMAGKQWTPPFPRK